MTKRISARSRITVGLVALLGSVLMLAIAIGLVPSTRDAVMRGRAQVCETLAISSSILASRGDMTGLAALLDGVAGRNADVLSAAVRRIDGSVVASVGEHEQNWNDQSAARAGDAHVYVPISSQNEKWGVVELRFRALGRTGVLGLIFRPAVQLVAFVVGGCFALYWLYLRKMLQHLDPSKVVPGRVRSALDTLAEGLLVLDDRERIVLANSAFAAIARRAPDELLGVSAAKLPWVRDDASGSDAGEAELPWTQAIATGVARRNVMLRLRDALGEVRTFVVNCSPVLGHNGKYRGVLASFEDVTQMEAQKVELRHARDAAESANRAKSEFLARMSHEIRTPMNAIIGFADVLRRGFEESEAERQEYLDTIHSSGQHLLELINDILDLSKIESGRIALERTRCSPHQVITEVVNVLRVRAKQKGITLSYGWDGGIPVSIQTDPTRLRQVLTNLVGNAIKFTETGGVRVVARLAGDERSPKLAIDVIDSGIGIKPEDAPKLFQPFVQADTSITRRFGGTGLGLAISRQLAEAMGGGISIASEPGKGSTFTVTIDTGALDGVAILEAPPVAGAAAATHARAAGDGKANLTLPPLRVLSADDGLSNQKLITLVLGRAGAAAVDTVANGKLAVEKALGGGYDVILMDMQMPVMDGYTAVRELRSRGVATPIIALTAHAMKSEEQKCLAAGCTAFVPKPIEMDRLIRAVAAATGTHAVATPSRAAGRASGGASPLGAAASTAPIQSTLPTDDPDFREVVVEFVDRLSQQVSAMQQAWERRELGDLAQLAHWLKGSGGTAGFNDFTDPARRLESSAKEARIEDVAAAVEELKQLAARVAAPPSSSEASRPSPPAPYAVETASSAAAKGGL